MFRRPMTDGKRPNAPASVHIDRHGRQSKGVSRPMFCKTLAAFAAAAAAFAVGAPVASAAVTDQPLSASEADGTITFSYKVPAGLPSAVLVDFDADGVSD